MSSPLAWGGSCSKGYSISFWLSVFLQRSTRDHGQVRPFPERVRKGQGIDALLLPKDTFVAAPVQLPMMQPTDRHSEAVAYLAPHGPRIRELDVVRVRRGAAAYQARLARHEFQMAPITLAHRLAANDDLA